jgi:putative endonuclease
MVKVWVYILQSDTSGRFYCGQTNDLGRRIKQHNDPSHRETRTTKRFEGPWSLVWSQECPNRSEGMRLERAIKKRGISRFLQGTTATSRRVSSGC